MQGKSVLLRTNRFRPQGDPRKRDFSAPIAIRSKVPAVPAKNRTQHVSRAAPTHKARYPSDAAVRTAAIDAAHAKRSSKVIVNFKKVVHKYCAMILGFKDRKTVEEYIYLRLKGFVDQRKTQKVSVDAVALERESDRLFADIEEAILIVARQGRRIKRDLEEGVEAVMGFVGVRRSAKCFLTIESRTRSDDGEEFVLIKAFQTAKEFDRHRRSRLKRGRSERYSQRPRPLRRMH